MVHSSHSNINYEPYKDEPQIGKAGGESPIEKRNSSDRPKTCNISVKIEDADDETSNGFVTSTPRRASGDSSSSRRLSSPTRVLEIQRQFHKTHSLCDQSEEKYEKGVRSQPDGESPTPVASDWLEKARNIHLYSFTMRIPKFPRNIKSVIWKSQNSPLPPELIMLSN